MEKLSLRNKKFFLKKLWDNINLWDVPGHRLPFIGIRSPRRAAGCRPYVILGSICALFLIAPQTTFASWNAGLPGAVFRMPAGAWVSGMGGAAAADPEYMLAWYNPAQLPHLRERRASLGAGLRSLGRTESWASYDFRVPPRMGMGLSLVYRGDPFINNMYDGYYRDGDVVDERPLSVAAWSAVSVKAGVGYLASRRLTIGGSVAVNYQSLPTAPDDLGKAHNSTVTSIGAIDLAAAYKLTAGLTLSASVKNLMSSNSWQLHSEFYSPMIEEVVPPLFVFGSSHKTKLLERELVWNADAVIYLIDGEGTYLGHPELGLSAGAKWKFSDAITLRAGVGDMEFSGDMWRDSKAYADGFSPRLAAGFSYGLSKWMKGAAFNYAIMTDRIWAGVDQQFDLAVSF